MTPVLTPGILQAGAAAIAALDRAALHARLDRDGWALLPALFDAPAIAALLACAPPQGPGIAAGVFAPLRAALYAQLAPLANAWAQTLQTGWRYPASAPAGVPPDIRLDVVEAGHARPLTQHEPAPDVFPLQLVVLLSDPKRDFAGGELVLTEQRPRMQSRPIVIPLRQGDAALIPTAHRPCRGAHGFYRASLRQAISPVRAGRRVGLALLP
ncbi:2OG-Fe(II) oxygenase [Bordetella bronchiseptica]|uniref:2OG-Fe(II) oxygenase n=1 Tax=Bordetella bronchiseptica TaxID=518 RepID=UPI00045A0441|nr:2OG-Fe(II) oxygenase [Bordetella bronchiseptica]KAK53205.1 damaged DNA methylation oxygenase [Bordetella bronchiseptica OSU054]KDB71712.1 damaged DNA methylation oxygenase [Bordetella bronchiseptica CA90 BB1334]KDD43861.1 damaged DNA methylation oxygenase [Bordetella bronchiseptica OSU095]